MRDALRRTGLDVKDLGWIKAHATSTRQGDEAEAIAICNLTKPYDILCSAPKSVTGHLLGASGAAEAAFAAMSLHEQVIPPTINLDDQDPGCPVHCVRVSTPSNAEFALLNSWGFGGSACCIVLGRI
jgi:3-oxoacyl-[acyl-carrier-protein] synthase II